MEEILLFAFVGFCATFVDGALGMGFGPTSSSLMLATGVNPKTTAAMVNLVKVATGLAGAAAHWRFGNVDRRLVARLAVPGCVGAVIGVTVLSNVDADTIRPILHTLLVLVSIRILFRYRTAPRVAESVDGRMPQVNLRGAEGAGLVGGVTNGMIGAWGPVVTPFLLHRGLPARFSIGSVNTAEVAVAVVATGSLFTSGGLEGLDIATAVAMLVGGVVAAPIAAWVIRFLPVRGLGIAVGGMLLFTSTRELAGWQELGLSRWIAYGAIAAALVATTLYPRWQRATADVVLDVTPGPTRVG